MATPISRYSYAGPHVLMDVTVTQMKPGSTHMTAITGSVTDPAGNKSQITNIGSLQAMVSTALSGTFADATEVILISPVDAGGVIPDCLVYPVPDSKPLGDVMLFDASLPGNMAPNPAQIVGPGAGKAFSLGVPVRKALQQAARDQANGKTPNLPLVATGIKYAQQLQFAVYSTAGWGNSGAAEVPLRIIVLGEKLDRQNLDDLARYGWPGAFRDQARGFNGISGTHTIPGGVVSASSWTALSGGIAQGSVKTFRAVRVAYNATATPQTGLFVLSNQNSVQGAQGNVQSQTGSSDLGFDYTSEQKYLRITHLGIRPGPNSGFWGWKIDDTVLPDEPNGQIVSQGVNPWPYGNVQPQRSASGEFYGLPKTAWPLAAEPGHKLAFFIQADGTAIAANTESVALAGVLVEQGQGASVGA